MGRPGPTSISGALNPGDELAAYRIDGTAGEQLRFHSLSTLTTNGSWFLEGEKARATSSSSGPTVGKSSTSTRTLTAARSR